MKYLRLKSKQFQTLLNMWDSSDKEDLLLGWDLWKQLSKNNKRRFIEEFSKRQNINWKFRASEGDWMWNSLMHTSLKTTNDYYYNVQFYKRGNTTQIHTNLEPYYWEK